MAKMMLDSNMDDGLVAGGASGSSFRYSAVRPDNLGATEYTLVYIAVDNSGSVGYFKKELDDCLKAAVEACQRSPRAENLLVRVVEFNGQLNEIHGFKLLNAINVADYNITTPHGSTALCDAAYSGLGSIQSYGHTLYDQEFNVNAIMFVITDGEENCSKTTAAMVKQLKEQIVREEEIESILSILVGVNVGTGGVNAYLDQHKVEAGYDQFVAATDASKGTLARLASFVSKSISSQSQSLGTGGPSQTLATF